jgi:DNA helicase-2/ATP-dependent DNA helicase PcrA
MRHLYITYAEQRRMHGIDSYGQASRFINEIPEELVEEVRPRICMQRARGAATVGGGRASVAPRLGGSAAREDVAPGIRLGARVRHAKFGDGVVLNIEGQGPHARIQVNFESQGSKWLMLAYANLEAAR